MKNNDDKFIQKPLKKEPYEKLVSFHAILNNVLIGLDAENFYLELKNVN